MLFNLVLLEKACYVSVLGKDDANTDEQQREYSLPDGEKIMIGSAKYRAPEILFNPECKDDHLLLFIF